MFPASIQEKFLRKDSRPADEVTAILTYYNTNVLATVRQRTLQNDWNPEFVVNSICKHVRVCNTGTYMKMSASNISFVTFPGAFIDIKEHL
jgi:hypothetical protein